MNPKEWVLDRIEQSFELFKKWFFYITLPFFVYSLVSFVFFGALFLLFLWTWYISNFTWVFDYINLVTPRNLIVFSVLIIIFLTYIILYIPFFIFTVKVISDLYNWNENIDIKWNLSYSLTNFFSIFKTYWYIFSYVALIPALIFIFGWVLFNLGFFLELGDIYYRLGWLLMLISVLIFIFFAVYRWIKTTFSLYSAIDKTQYTKENFKNSVNLTNNKWWRVLWNIFLVAIIVSLLSWIISWFTSFFFSWPSFWFETFMNLENLSSLFSWFYIISFIIWGLVNLILETIWAMFILVFGFILYKRFELEALNWEWKVNLNEKEDKNEEIKISSEL